MSITIDEAIKVFKSEQKHGIIDNMDDWNNAIKLGIEAFKRIKAKRLHFEVDIDRLLTGESK